uniref:Uncharacterized protein n=1 Tax=Lygus hesperus TaxID=30085 RepID=A0A146MF00_LYGHE
MLFASTLNDKSHLTSNIQEVIQQAMSAVYLTSLLQDNNIVDRSNNSNTNNNSKNIDDDNSFVSHPNHAIPDGYSLYRINGILRFVNERDANDNKQWQVPLSETTLRNTLDTSARFLRSVITCALNGTLDALHERRHAALRAILQFARLVPINISASNEANLNDDKMHAMVTSEGVNFCMLPLHQQW